MLCKQALSFHPDSHFSRSRVLYFPSDQSVNPDDPSLYSSTRYRRTSACQDKEGTAPGVRCRSSQIFSSALSLSEVLILSRGISKFTALSSCFPVWSHIAENQLVTITCLYFLTSCQLTVNWSLHITRHSAIEGLKLPGIPLENLPYVPLNIIGIREIYLFLRRPDFPIVKGKQPLLKTRGPVGDFRNLQLHVL